ncbi:MAG: trypsin-like peptidase domain-containing protein [Acidimicrobiia bacterium]|nr:trypsin-like peptidase domain-containing protein [Acidimicrobiia bacterium]
MRAHVSWLLMLTVPALAQEVPGAFHAGEARARTGSSAAAALVGLPDAPLYELGGINVPQTAGGQSFRSRVVGSVRQLGEAVMTSGEWRRLPDEQWVWRVAVRSPDAKEIRLHVTGLDIGEGKLVVYPLGQPDSSRAQEFTGLGLFGDGEFWTASVPGDAMEVGYFPHSGRDGLTFRLASVGHSWEDTLASTPAPAQPSPETTGKAASAPSLSAAKDREVLACHLDVNCYQDWRSASSGVARILFVSGQFMASCSGALINSRSNTGTPLFLTADHCIANQAEARSVQANFFFETGSCGATSPDTNRVETVLGAEYLTSGSFPRGDFSLIQLTRAPAGAFFFGWSLREPQLWDKLVGIHHPAGSFKRISFGDRAPDETAFIGGGPGTYAPADHYYQVDLRQGRAEGGSSGSPLLNLDKQIIGMLSYGPVFSPDPAENDILLCKRYDVIVGYGRLTKAFDALRPFLEDLRPARIAVPQDNEKLTGPSVTFHWTPGVGASEYRLEIGTRPGASDIFQRSAGLARSMHVTNLPVTGAAIYVRLSTLLQGNWQAVDHTYVTASGPVSRPASIIAPETGTSLSGSSVRFVWERGVQVSEYLLQVGTTAGGAEILSRNMGTETNATVTDLPVDGRFIYVRLHSRIGPEWRATDAAYRAADQRPGKVLARFTNRLRYPVVIKLNGNVLLSVQGGAEAQREISADGTVTIAYEMVRPLAPGTNVPLGEAVQGSFAPVERPSGILDYIIANDLGGRTIFTPVVSNPSSRTYLLSVNGVPCNCSLAPRGAPIELGYYTLSGPSNVRGFFDVLGYSGQFTELRNFAQAVEAPSGVVRLELR